MLTPREHESTQPPLRSDLFKDHVGRNLEKDVRDGEGEEGDIVPIAFWWDM